MSDSSKQYSIQINTEVTGEESVEKLNSTIDETTSKFTRLQTQIKETKTALQQAEAAGDSINFNRLKSQLDELEDSFEINRMKSQQLDDQLSNMPGTLGNVGSSIKQVDGVFKMLSANPILLVLGLVAGAFLLVKKSLESTKEGTAALTRVTDAFGSVIKPIFNWISSIAVPVIEAFAEGIEWLSSAMGNVKEPISDVTEAMKKQMETFDTAKTKYEDDLKTYNSYVNKKKEILENDRISEEERTAWLKENEFKKNKFVSEVLNESTKTYRKFLKDHNEEVDRINEKAENDRKATEKQNAADREQRRKDYAAKQLAASELMFQTELTFLDDQNKELTLLEKQHIKDQKTLKEAGFNDESEEMLKLNNSYNIKKGNINDKYTKLNIERVKKETDDTIKLYEESFQKIYDLDIQSKEKFLTEFSLIADNENESINTRLEANKIATEREEELFRKTNNITIQNEKSFQNQILAIRQKGADKKIQIQLKEIEDQKSARDAYINIAGGFGSLMQQIADQSDASLESTKGLKIAGIIVEKAAAIGSIISNTMAANAATVALYPGPAAPLAVPIITAQKISAGIGIASTIAGAISAISEINSVSKDSKSSGGGGMSLPTYPTAPTVAAPQVNVTEQNTVGQQVSNTLNNKPTKVYVTASDVSSVQALDRRTKESATF